MEQSNRILGSPQPLRSWHRPRGHDLGWSWESWALKATSPGWAVWMERRGPSLPGRGLSRGETASEGQVVLWDEDSHNAESGGLG